MLLVSSWFTIAGRHCLQHMKINIQTLGIHFNSPFFGFRCVGIHLGRGPGPTAADTSCLIWELEPAAAQHSQPGASSSALVHFPEQLHHPGGAGTPGMESAVASALNRRRRHSVQSPGAAAAEFGPAGAPACPACSPFHSWKRAFLSAAGRRESARQTCPPGFHGSRHLPPLFPLPQSS